VCRCRRGLRKADLEHYSAGKCFSRILTSQVRQQLQERTASAPDLSRDLGVTHATAIVVGTIIGSGIFLVPAEMMQAVGSARLVYLAWLVGGILSFAGALTYAELGAMKPQAGGEYVYVRDGYGPLAGFLYAWTTFLISKPASIATVTTGFVRILGEFPLFSFFAAPLIARPFPITYGQIVAITAAAFISFLNYVGIKKAGEFQLIFTILKVGMILAIVAIGFSYTSGQWSNFSSDFLGAKGGTIGFMAALVAALWAYDGWNDLNMVAGEIRHPERSIPISLVAGVAIVGGLYVLVNAAVQFVLPASAIALSQRPASEATAIVLGKVGASVVSAGMALSMLVTLNGTTMSGARVPFAVARDGYFFHSLAKVHPRFHTPSVSIIVQAILAMLLLLVGGNFRQLFSLAIFAEWLFYMITGSTVFIFRNRDPEAVRPYKVWGYPVVPALFVLASAILLYYTFTDNLRNSALGSLVILAGVPVFYLFTRHRTE
ncbi:MAG TPA: amino acid permease, partial [Terriglobales bacterium]|nr:amino acid permease [Terriglobales bacterium]